MCIGGCVCAGGCVRVHCVCLGDGGGGGGRVL